ncbi:MAG: hypothetical protein H0X39_00200 [Actinobacteria bacterium]|nr:hypothetical protein [Actinomycetota bacterium]
MSATLKSALIRAARSFITAFIIVYPVAGLIGVANGTNPVDWSLARSAAVSGGIALGSFIWRQFIDPLPVPTLADKTTYPAVDGNDANVSRTPPADG